VHDEENGQPGVEEGDGGQKGANSQWHTNSNISSFRYLSEIIMQWAFGRVQTCGCVRLVAFPDEDNIRPVGFRVLFSLFGSFVGCLLPFIPEAG